MGKYEKTKLSTIFIALITPGNTWELPATFQKMFKVGSTPTIPQFILDTDHPWIQDNKGWLSSHRNVERELCSKVSSLWRDGAHGQTLPKDLFARINIDNNKAGISRQGWKNAAARLEELKICPAALEDATELYVDIYVHDSMYADFSERESTMPPSSLPKMFVDTVASIPFLERLSFGVSARSTPAFEAAFAEANITLPSIKYLVPGAYSEWLIPRCPNLKFVQAGSYFDHWSWNHYEPELEKIYQPLPAVINALIGMPVQELNLRASWTPELLESMPHLAGNLCDDDR
jgi:hypothetical protein